MQSTNARKFGTYFREAAIAKIEASVILSLFMTTAETQLCVPLFTAQGVVHNCYCPGIVNYLLSKVALEFPTIYFLHYIITYIVIIYCKKYIVGNIL